MKIELEINEKQLVNQISKAVHEYLRKQGLLRFIREEISRTNRMMNRKELTDQIAALNRRLTSIEKILNPK